MATLASYVVAGLAVVLVTDYFSPLVGARAELAGTAAVAPAPTVSTQGVDRSHKGDRLDWASRRNSDEAQPFEVRPVPIQVFRQPQPLKLPAGCDALVSPLSAQPLLARIAGRCFT